MKPQKFYKDLTIEKRRKLRGQLEQLTEHRKKQIEIIENGLIKPLKDCNNLVEQVKKNMVSIERYIEINERIMQRHKDFFEIIKKGDSQ